MMKQNELLKILTKNVHTLMMAALILFVGIMSFIDSRRLVSIDNQNSVSIQMKKHIDDYALFSVDKTNIYDDGISSFNTESSVLPKQWDTERASSNNNRNLSVNTKDMDEDQVNRREVVIAVIDTGIDFSHPDIVDHMWVNPGEIDGDNIDNDNNGYIDDIYGWDFYNNDASIGHYDEIVTNKSAYIMDNDNHGTHIAGIIAAVAKDYANATDLGINLDIKIMSLKINGGVDGSGKLMDAVKAVKYAKMMGADICNISWGTDVYSEELYQIMKETDMLFVAAAGNSGDNNDLEPIYPANLKLDNLISVTSADTLGGLNEYSNYGVNTVDIAAPGNNIYSTIIGGYAYMSGSSMAAPQVSAVAALYFGYEDNHNPSKIKELIIDAVKPLPELRGKIRYAGIVDMNEAVTSFVKSAENVIEQKMVKETEIKENGINETEVKENTVKENGIEKISIVIEGPVREKNFDFQENERELSLSLEELYMAKQEDFFEGLVRDKYQLYIIFTEEIMPLETEDGVFERRIIESMKKRHHHYMRS